MNRRIALVSAALAIALPPGMSACGNKGPLVLPDQAPAETTVPAEPAPATPAPAQTPPADPPAPPAR
jgi:predicted small lipoprotein YifL